MHTKDTRIRPHVRRRNRRRLLVAAVALLVVAGLVTGAWALLSRGDTPAPKDPTGHSVPGVPDDRGDSTPAPSLDLSDAVKATLDQSITAKNVLLYDATNDRVLYSRAADEKCYPASITKLMTAAIAVKYARGDDPFIIDKAVYLMDAQASSAYLKLGMSLTLPQMLDALLLPSGADAAYQLAVTTVRRAFPDTEWSNFDAAMKFCDLMNEAAAEIGAKSTFFVNPDGIYHSNHVTTAEDLLKVMRYALSFDAVKEAFSKPEASFTTVDGKPLSYKNTNLLLANGTSYYYPYATGGKTGFTDEAGYCLASTAEKDGVTLYALVLGCPEMGDRFTDSATLFSAGFSRS